MVTAENSTFRQETTTKVDVRRFRLVVVEGPNFSVQGKSAGKSWESSGDRCSIGKHPANDLTIDDASVSRFHCEIRIHARGPRIHDLGSSNGTMLDGVNIEAAYPRDRSLIRLGSVLLRLELLNATNPVPLSGRVEFGSLVGSSAAMRVCYSEMERAARCSSTVLFLGETGTGKTTAAEVIHLESHRSKAPFIVVDCGTLPPQLMESELFGHEKGAFTGADKLRRGAFEEADEGTVFLDEIAELPLDLQVKLLRVIETRKIRRIGNVHDIKVDVRIMAATHKDLRTEMNAGRFRQDLYYRLEVLPVRLPALRERPEDIPALAKELLEKMGVNDEIKAKLLRQETLAELQGAAWSGNIRELRNYLERCAIFEQALPIRSGELPAMEDVLDVRRTLAQVRDRVIETFEKKYLQAVLEKHGGNVTKAAQAAGISRIHFHRLLHKYGIPS